MDADHGPTLAGNLLAYEHLRLSEDVVAKALRISELAQMARIELRARQLLDKQWNLLAKRARIRAVAMAKKGQGAKAIAAAVDKIMGQWAKVVEKSSNKDVAAVYKLARKIGHKKGTKKTKASLAFNTPNLTDQVAAGTATIKTLERIIQKATAAQVLPSFDLADEEAIAALQGRNTFWIGEHYSANISASIADTTREVIAEAGRSRTIAGALMAERIEATLGAVITPGGFHGSSIQYFEGLTANAMTVARTYGQLRSFADIGITRYTIVNPSDERTCPICSHMNGKVFTVKQGVDQMAAELEAKNPEDIKTTHPWLGIAGLLRVSKTPGRISGTAGARDSAALAGAGQSLSPFHFRCRCTVDIDADVGSFSDLA